MSHLILVTYFLDDVDDNVAVASAPYDRLPEKYPSSSFPVSYYATHTFVPPIENLYSTNDTLKGYV